MDTNTEIAVDGLRDALFDLQHKPELVLQVLLEQGWVNEEGVLAEDIEPLLDEALEMAFPEDETEE